MIAIDHCALAMAVEAPDGPQIPVVSVAIARPSGRILACFLSLSPPTAATSAKMLTELVGAQTKLPANDTEVLPVQFGTAKSAAWNELRTAASTHLQVAEEGRLLKPGSILRRICGVALGNIRYAPGRTTAPRKGFFQGVISADQPLSLQQAKAAVDDAVAIHNKGREMPRFTIVTDQKRTEFLHSLAKIMTPDLEFQKAA